VLVYYTNIIRDAWINKHKTSAVVLNECGHVPLGAACYCDVAFCVSAECSDSTCICCVTSHCVTTSDDLKYDADFVASLYLC
jgi:hypothetical protein